MAELVSKLTEAGVIVIAFDIFFSEPEINPVSQIESQFPNFINSNKLTINEVKKKIDADERSRIFQ